MRGRAWSCGCSIEGCDRRASKRGMCSMHYLRWWKHGDPLFIPIRSYRRPVLDRLRANAVRRKPRPGQAIGCLEIRKGARSGPYGLLQINNKARLAHRVAYEAVHGPIPEGMFVCHECDNGICIEPTHLFAGRPVENTADMIRKGRARRATGDKVHRKLTPSKVREIRCSEEPSRVLAQRYGVHKATISSVRRRLTWASV